MALTMKQIMERMNPGGTPGSKNPSGSVRLRTMRSGKGVVPLKSKSTTVAGKRKKIRKLKGGTANTAAARKRGGYGAARANLGFAAANGPIKPVIGRAK